MLKFARTSNGSLSAATATSSNFNSISSALRPIINRKTSFVTSDCGYSKATVVLKSISLPLAWPSDEYFSSKKEKRTFTVQILVKTADGKEFYSKPVENVDKSHIDVIFDDILYIEDQAPDFKLELTVFCRRTDENSNNIQTFSRSVGKSMATSLKRYVQSWNTNTLARMQQLDANFIENYRDPNKMFLLGSAEFKLQNASLSGRKHNYALRLYQHAVYGGIPKSHILPLFGQISLILLVQPLSLANPLGQGTLDVFYVEAGILLEKLFCILQGSFLKCFNCNPQNITKLTKPDMLLPINEHTLVESTAFQTALRIKLTDQDSGELRHFVCVCGTKNSLVGWKHTLALQIKDSEVWGGFAISTSNPVGASIPPKPPKPGTFSRNVRFEGQNEMTGGFSVASQPRYGFELQSTRRPRPPIANAFNHIKESPTPKPRKISQTSVVSYSTNSPKPEKPMPKPRANSEVPSSNPYVISLRIGSYDDQDVSINKSSLDSDNSQYVYEVGTRLNKPPTMVNRSTTLYNNRAKNEITRL